MFVDILVFDDLKNNKPIFDDEDYEQLDFLSNLWNNVDDLTSSLLYVLQLGITTPLNLLLLHYTSCSHINIQLNFKEPNQRS